MSFSATILLNGDKWLTVSKINWDKAHHHYKPEKLKQKCLKNLDYIVSPK